MTTLPEGSDRSDASIEGAKAEPSGLGGWLILPALGLCLSPFIIAFSLYQTVQAIDTPGYGQLTNPASPRYNPLYKSFLITEMAANVALIAFVLVTTVYFFRKHRLAPRLMITFYIASFLILVLDAALASWLLGVAIDKQSVKEIGRSVVTMAIWVPYFLVSKRVANTFGAAWTVI